MSLTLPSVIGNTAELKSDNTGAGGQNSGGNQNGDHDRFDVGQGHGLQDSFGERRDGKRDGRGGGEYGTGLRRDRQRGFDSP